MQTKLVALLLAGGLLAGVATAAYALTVPAPGAAPPDNAADGLDSAAENSDGHAQDVGANPIDAPDNVPGDVRQNDGTSEDTGVASPDPADPPAAAPPEAAADGLAAAAENSDGHAQVVGGAHTLDLPDGGGDGVEPGSPDGLIVPAPDAAPVDAAADGLAAASDASGGASQAVGDVTLNVPDIVPDDVRQNP